MTTPEVVSFAITIGLGVLSITLAVFSILLSWKFNDRSTGALDAVKSLATEIRSLIDATVAQQKEFSSRMLDSILEKGPYGRSAADVQKEANAMEEVVRRQLDETEKRIADSVESKIRSLKKEDRTDPATIQRMVDSIRNEIRMLADQAASTVSASAKVSESLKKMLMRWIDRPAHYQLLAAIISENAMSEEQVRKHREKYGIPEPLEAGLSNLLDAGILVGTRDTFQVPTNLSAPLAAWVDRNWPIINKLKHVEGVEDKTIVAKGLDF